jgi:hypothetical protein
MDTTFNTIAEKEFKENLEKVIDSKGMNYVFMSLVEILYGKGEHLAENWQDHSEARRYNKAAAQLDTFRLRREETFQGI